MQDFISSLIIPIIEIVSIIGATMAISTSLQRISRPLCPVKAGNVQFTWRGLSVSQNLSTAASKHQNRIPASYYRGGTSRAIMFKEKDLPKNREQWGEIFLGAIGSPDRYAAQANGQILCRD